MKKIITTIVIVLIMMLSNFKMNAQADNLLVHVGPPAFYLGWGAAQLTPLDIRHDGLADINFYTGGPLPPFQRMTIKGTGYVNPGFVGIGQGFLAPLSLLHVDGTNNLTGEVFRTDCPIGSAADPITRWRMFRTGTERGTLWNPWADVNFPGPNSLWLRYTPNDFLLDAPQGSFIVRGWTRDLNGTDGLNEVFRTTTLGSMLDWDLTPMGVDGLQITTQDKNTFFDANIDLFTGPGGETTVKLDRNGTITGRQNAFFVIGQRYGIVMDANITGSPNPGGPILHEQHIVFKINNSEGMRVCPGPPDVNAQHFVRIGENTFDPILGLAGMGAEATRR